MMLFRRAKESDLDAIFHLAEQSGIGMTTLPQNKDLLKKRLEWSENSFKKNPSGPESEYYFFVLENTLTGEVVGSSAIEASIGHDLPFYNYKLTKRTRICHDLEIRSDYEVLSLVNDNQGKSEICTLFLEPDSRKNGNGLLLSRARFLFMAQHPHRFATDVIAEMRGVSDEHGRSPFWDNIGSHFFQMNFAEADRLTLSTNKQFISDLMPRNPIYVKLLSPEAQAVIGKPHPSTEPAMHILHNEGFRYHHDVDIFDGGPTIEVPLKEIKTIRSSRLMTIKKSRDEVTGDRYLMANTQLNFRATLDHAIISDDQHSCIISEKVADLLQIQAGEHICIAPFIDKTT